jgi:outer membrane protein OmpA-like peptidoglycan-associated protein
MSGQGKVQRGSLEQQQVDPDEQRTPRTPGKHNLAETEPPPVDRPIFRSASGAGLDLSQADELVARAAASSGSQLPEELRRKFERSLGADLGSVRVHTGEVSAQAASAVGAGAYAVGQDIHFAAGRFDPSSAGGERLLAHEVAHTVQQAGAAPSVRGELEVSQPGEASEVEAEHAAAAMVAGRGAQVGPGAALVARGDPDEEKEKAKQELEEFKRSGPFQRQRMSVDGRGCFDVVLNPAGHLLAIYQRLLFSFVDGIEADAVPQGAKAEDFKWTEKAAQDWTDAYIAKVGGAWGSDATGLVLRSTNPHWKEYAISVEVRIEADVVMGKRAADPKDSAHHFFVKVKKIPKDVRKKESSSVTQPGQKAKAEDPFSEENRRLSKEERDKLIAHTGTDAGEVTLSSGDIEEGSKGLSSEIVEPYAIKFDKNSATLSGEGESVAAAAGKRLCGPYRAAHANVEGRAMEDENDPFALSQQRGQAVVAKMRAQTAAPISMLVEGSASREDAGRYAGQRADVTLFLKGQQATAVHEMGHQLGLDDDYEKSTKKPFDGHEDSIMAEGGEIMPKHYRGFARVASELTKKEWVVG